MKMNIYADYVNNVVSNNSNSLNWTSKATGCESFKKVLEGSTSLEHKKGYKTDKKQPGEKGDTKSQKTENKKENNVHEELEPIENTYSFLQIVQSVKIEGLNEIFCFADEFKSVSAAESLYNEESFEFSQAETKITSEDAKTLSGFEFDINKNKTGKIALDSLGENINKEDVSEKLKINTSEANETMEKTGKETEQNALKLHKSQDAVKEENFEKELSEAPKPMVLEETEPKVIIKVADVSSSESLELAAKEIGEAIVENAKDGKIQKLNITMNPKELGSIKVEFVVKDDKVLVSLVCSNEQTKNLLESNLNGLAKVINSNLNQETIVNIYSNKAEQENQNYDGRGNNHGGQRESNQKEKEDDKTDLDFLQRLRLGILESGKV